jgi:cbb3-type cytochrome oxidase cytochrome c subunit
MTTENQNDPFRIDTNVDLDQTVEACPNCDSPQVRSGDRLEHRCLDCESEFDDPVERGPKKHGRDLPRLLRQRTGGDA